MALICLGAAVWSIGGTQDRGVWAFEVLPLGAALIGLGIWAKRFRFTTLTYSMLTLVFLVQCIGGRYTFAQVPVPDVVLDALHLDRNPVDRVGHFLQGFVAAIVLREMLIRGARMPVNATMFWLITGTCLGFSALYELLEAWVVMLFYPDAGPEWLGTQGDPWDAQWDMTIALIGAMLAQLTLGRWQERILASLNKAL